MNESPIETIADASPWLDGLDLEKTPLPKIVEALGKDISRIATLTREENKREYYERKLAKAKAHYSFEGVLTDKAAGVAREAADSAMQRYHERTKAEAQLILKLAPMLDAAADAWIASGKQLPEPSYDGPRRMLQIEEQKELRLRYTGRPVRELLELYLDTPDTAHGGDVTRFIEAECRAGWPTLKPDVDAVTSQKLQGAIRARETKRVPAERLAVKEQLTELTGLAKMLWLQEVAGIARRAQLGA